VKKYWLLFLVAYLLCEHVLHAQSQADLQKMMEEAKKQINETSDMDSAVKQQILEMMNSSEITQTIKNEKENHPTQKLHTLPTLDRQRLASLPANPLSRSQLITMVRQLTSTVEAQSTSEEKSAVKSSLAKAKGHSEYLSTESVLAWYNGIPRQALLLAANAATMENNTNALTNLGAMLNLCGYEEKAVPLLLFASKMDQNNSTILNNLGRAYLGLGDKKKAETFYLSCLRYAPHHPEANNALGCLYEEQGDKPRAEEHFKKSLEGAYNEEAASHLDWNSDGASYAHLIASHHKPPETFDQFRFRIPEECSGRSDYNIVKERQENFQKSIKRLSSEYLLLSRQSNQKGKKEAVAQQKQIMEGIRQRQIPIFSQSPMASLAGRMILFLSSSYISQLSVFKKDYEKRIQELEQQYFNELEASKRSIEDQLIFGTEGEFTGCLNCDGLDERLCQARGIIVDKYQLLAAGVHSDFKDKYRLVLTGYFDQLAYWNYFTSVPASLQDGAFYQLITQFLDEIIYLSKSTPLWASPGTCDQQASIDETEEKYPPNVKPHCPININIPFIVGKLTFDCSAFSLSGGEGIKAGYKKDFISGQTTLSIGMGLTLEVPGAGSSISAGADGSFYVTFDKSGQPTDAGVKYGVSGKLAMGPVNTGAGVDYTVGINSGWNYTANAAGNVVKF
jgi:tetratricopeptide (TPR) repeat protein